MSTHPWDWAQAQVASEEAKTAQRESAENLRKDARDLARKERLYRVALARRILELKAEGHAITACGDLARGDERIAELKFERDVAEGAKEATGQAAWGASADRRDTLTFIEWSLRAAFRDEQEPATTSVIAPALSLSASCAPFATPERGGVTRVDFARIGSPPSTVGILNFPARIMALKAQGNRIEKTGWRQKCSVYVLREERNLAAAPEPAPASSTLFDPNSHRARPVSAIGGGDAA